MTQSSPRTIDRILQQNGYGRIIRVRRTQLFTYPVSRCCGNATISTHVSSRWDGSIL